MTRLVDSAGAAFRIGNAAVSYVRYLAKVLWPSDLALYYPHPAQDLYVVAVLASLAVLAAVSILVLRGRKSRPYLPVGWLWYLGSLVPVIGVVQVGSQAMADRYTYIPLIGCFVMASWGLWDAGRKRTISKPLLAGRNQSEEAFRHLAEAIRIDPDHMKAHHVLGVLFRETGDLTAARRFFSRALEIDPGFVKARKDLRQLDRTESGDGADAGADRPGTGAP